MARIGILGGSGIVGKAAAELLSRRDDLTITLMGRSESKLRAAADEIGAGVLTKAVDATDQAELTRALEEIDLVLVAAPLIDSIETVLAAALASGTAWVDTLMDSPRTAPVFSRFGPGFAQAGLALLVGAGVHPGLPAPLIRYVAQQIPSLTSAEVGILLSVDWKTFPITDSTAQEMVMEFSAMSAGAWLDGHYQSLSWVNPKSMRKTDFGPPHGRKTTVLLALDELRDLPGQLPQLQTVTLTMAGFSPLFDYVVMPIGMVMAKLNRRLAAPAGRFWLRTLGRGAKPPYETVVVFDGTTPDHDPIRLVLRHPDGYWLTAAAAAATASQWADKLISTTGLSAAGLAVDPTAFITSLETWGVAIERTNLAS